MPSAHVTADFGLCHRGNCGRQNCQGHRGQYGRRDCVSHTFIIVGGTRRRYPETPSGPRENRGPLAYCGYYYYFLVTVSVKLPLPSFSQVMVPFWNSLIQPPLATFEPPPVSVSSAVGQPSAPVGPPCSSR